MRPFEIHQPHSVEQASQWLDDWGEEAALYAGGTELLLLLKEDLVHYPHLIDLKTVPGLADVELDEDHNVLSFGPLTTHRMLEKSQVVQERAPLLAEVESMVANVRVRAAGTVGGNLCFAEPHSDPATLLLAWGADLELASAQGQRRVPVDDFFLGLFSTSLEHNEVLTQIRLPLLPAGAGGGYQKFGIHERPTATVAAILALDEGVVEWARFAVGSVGPRPIRCRQAEALLEGRPAGGELFAEASAIASDEVDPIDDLYGSSEYKKHLVRVLGQRALDQAWRRAERPEA